MQTYVNPLEQNNDQMWIMQKYDSLAPLIQLSFCSQFTFIAMVIPIKSADPLIHINVKVFSQVKVPKSPR